MELALTDMYGKRHENIFDLPASWEAALTGWILNDPRDLRLFLAFLQVTLWMAFSSAVQLLLLPRDGWTGYLWTPVHTVVTWLVLGQRFILAMHYAAHRPLIRPRLPRPLATKSAARESLASLDDTYPWRGRPW